MQYLGIFCGKGTGKKKFAGKLRKWDWFQIWSREKSGNGMTIPSRFLSLVFRLYLKFISRILIFLKKITKDDVTQIWWVTQLMVWPWRVVTHRCWFRVQKSYSMRCLRQLTLPRRLSIFEHILGRKTSSCRKRILTRMRQLELYVPEQLAAKLNHQAVRNWQI